MREVERKYLAKVEWLRLVTVARATGKSDAVQHIRQSYLYSGKNLEIRIRFCPACDSADNRIGFKIGNGYKRWEFEFDISSKLFDFLDRHAKGFYKIRLQINGWLIDKFLGDLRGLYLVEREEHEGEEKVEMPAGIQIIREVTNERTYANKNIAKLNEVQRKKLAKESRGT